MGVEFLRLVPKGHLFDTFGKVVPRLSTMKSSHADIESLLVDNSELISGRVIVIESEEVWSSPRRCDQVRVSVIKSE